jgi:hypothetical protein
LVNFNYSPQKIYYTLSLFLNAPALSYHQGKRTVSLIREFWDTLYVKGITSRSKFFVRHSTYLPVQVYNLRTLTGSAGKCTHKPVDVQADPFCTLTVTDEINARYVISVESQ